MKAFLNSPSWRGLVLAVVLTPAVALAASDAPAKEAQRDSPPRGTCTCVVAKPAGATAQQAAAEKKGLATSQILTPEELRRVWEGP